MDTDQGKSLSEEEIQQRKKVVDYEKLRPEDGLHLLSLPIGDFGEPYKPATFSHEDYPGLVPQGRTVDTLSIASVLATYNWDASNDCVYRNVRKRKVELFAEKLVEGFAELQSFDAEGNPEFHEKWQEIDLSAMVSSWRRLPEMSRLLDIDPDQLPPPRPCN